MMRLYLDANAIIYGVEGVEALRTRVLEWIDRVEAEPRGVLLTSELSLLECLVKPTRDGDEGTIREFQAFFDRERLFAARGDAPPPGPRRLRPWNLADCGTRLRGMSRPLLRMT